MTVRVCVTVSRSVVGTLRPSKGTTFGFGSGVRQFVEGERLNLSSSEETYRFSITEKERWYGGESLLGTLVSREPVVDPTGLPNQLPV